MRDAFGGIFMIRLLLVFIVIYVAFTAISLNYAKAFRVKNKVISYLEENDVIDLESFFSDGSGNGVSGLETILTDLKYNVMCDNGNGVINQDDVDKGDRPSYCYHGVLISEADSSVNNVIHYDVTTFSSWNLGALNMFLALAGKSQNSEHVIGGVWEITGEAKVVKRNASVDLGNFISVKVCPVTYNECNDVNNARSNDYEGNLEKVLLSRLISDKGLTLSNSCCLLSEQEPVTFDITHDDGTPNIYDPNIYGSIDEFVSNNADIIIDRSINYCHGINSFSSNVDVGYYSDTKQFYFNITCTSIDVVPKK